MADWLKGEIVKYSGQRSFHSKEKKRGFLVGWYFIVQSAWKLRCFHPPVSQTSPSQQELCAPNQHQTQTPAAAQKAPRFRWGKVLEKLMNRLNRWGWHGQKLCKNVEFPQFPNLPGHCEDQSCDDKVRWACAKIWVKATSACPCLGNLHMTVPRKTERSAVLLQPNPFETSATTVVSEGNQANKQASKQGNHQISSNKWVSK